jgi:hypothetical protein
MTIYSKRWSTKRLTQEEVISEFKKIHGNTYDYSLVEYKKMRESITIICPTHGNFIQTAESHKSGKGCHSCAQLSRNKNKSHSTEDVILKFKEVHGDKYDYSMINYMGYHSKITIICKKHGPFEKTPANHIGSSQGCSKCSREQLSNSFKIPISEWIKRFNEVHGKKYDYSLLDTKDKKIKIICPIHGIFFQAAKSHWRGHGCAKCSEKSVSKIGSSWLDSLNVPIREFKISTERQFLVDGFNPETNTVYEFYGDYWHGNPLIYDPTEINKTKNMTFGDCYKHTLEREKFIINLGYNLIVMWETDWLNHLSVRKHLNLGNRSE